MNQRTVVVEILQCNFCQKFAVSLNNTRVTNHKCDGAWTAVLTETVPEDNLLRAGFKKARK